MADSFVVKESSVLRINVYGKNSEPIAKSLTSFIDLSEDYILGFRQFGLLFIGVITVFFE